MKKWNFLSVLVFILSASLLFGACGGGGSGSGVSEIDNTPFTDLVDLTVTMSDAGAKSLDDFTSISSLKYAINIAYSANEQIESIALETSEAVSTIDYQLNDVLMGSVVLATKSISIPSLNLNLDDGLNTLKIIATAEDGVTTATFKFEINRAPNPTITELVDLHLTMSSAGSKSLTDFASRGIEKSYVIDIGYNAGEQLSVIEVETAGLVGNIDYQLNGISVHLEANPSEKNISIPLSNVNISDAVSTLKIIITALNGTDTETFEFKIIRLKMINVPGGSFDLDKGAEVPNGNIITMTISTNYRMAETETTQEVWEAVMGNNPSYYKTVNPEGGSVSLLPVERVSWYDAIAFCNKLSIAAGLAPVYSIELSATPGTYVNFKTLKYSEIPTSVDADWNAVVPDHAKNGYRLPTEMEWMWAAMGAQDSTDGYKKDFAGDDLMGSNIIDDYAWYHDKNLNKTHQVGSKAANELGLYDICGNVFEWCWDWYESIERYSTDDATDYMGVSGDAGNRRMVKGGGLGYGTAHCQLRNRAQWPLISRVASTGFRVVRQ